MLTKLAGFVGPTIGTSVTKVKRYSPELYLIGGIVAGVAAVVMTAKGHKKATNLTDDFKIEKEAMDDTLDQLELEDREPFSDMERTRAMLPVYMAYGSEYAKLYGPGIIMGLGSIALVLASHNVQKRRIGSLLSAVMVLEQGFNQYRQRVIAEMGEDADARFYHGAEQHAVVTMTVDEDGKKKKRKSAKNHIPEEYDPIMYDRIFDDTNTNWFSDVDLNRVFLESVQSHMNNHLYLKGYVTLNEIYKALGFSESPAGAVVGWSKHLSGDDFIDLGLDDDINAREGDVRWVISPNVNGVMYDLIGQ